MGLSVTGGGGRAARALRLLLLFVLALAAVEYLFGSILDASPLKTYLYIPGYNTTPAVSRIEKSSQWPKRTVSELDTSQPPEVQFIENQIANISTPNHTNSNRDIIENSSRVSNTTMGYNASSTPMLISKLLDGIRNGISEEKESKNNASQVKKLCPKIPPDLGPVSVNKTELELDFVDKKFPEVFWGGRFSPPDCKSRHRVAIIIPFRDRQQHLAIFLNHMHPFLMKQQLEYGIFIVEQSGASDFNRAKLMNVGFVESERLKSGGWQCFIFHDIDLLPLDGRNIYSCPRQPRHMSASIDKLSFKLPYEDIFGGVSAMTKEQFTRVNGFSNKYWGWGGEDDDMSYRLKKKNYHIARYKMSVARYAMLDHKKSSPNPKRYQLLSQTAKTFLKDGLTTLEYETVAVTQHHLYTHILVNIDERS